MLLFAILSFYCICWNKLISLHSRNFSRGRPHQILCMKINPSDNVEWALQHLKVGYIFTHVWCERPCEKISLLRMQATFSHNWSNYYVGDGAGLWPSLSNISRGFVLWICRAWNSIVFIFSYVYCLLGCISLFSVSIFFLFLSLISLYIFFSLHIHHHQTQTHPINLG